MAGMAGSASEAYHRQPRVPCPYLLSDDDDALPVHDRGFPLSPFELLTCEIIVSAAEAAVP